MKKLIITLCVFVAVCNLTSCNKEDFNETSNGSSKKGFEIIKYSSPNSRGVESNIMSFSSEQEFYDLRDSLDLVLENYLDNFERQNLNVNDVQLNDQIISNNIDLELPLTNFEDSYNFTSLRKTIINRENIWLANLNNTTTEPTPQIHEISNHAERSLWNDKGEIIIAGEIYKYTDDKFINIEDGSLIKLALINDGNTDIYADDAVSVENLTPANQITSNQSTICTNNRVNYMPYLSNSNTFRMEYGNSITPKKWRFGKYRMSAYIYTYQKLTGVYSGWYPFVTRLTTAYQGNRFISCQNNATATNRSETRRRKRLTIELVRENSFGVRFNAQACSEISNHFATTAGGYSLFMSEPKTLRYAN